jgi:uncharacterized protein (DUF952 family)
MNTVARPFRRIPATVLFFITQQPLGVDCRDWSSCPLGDFPGRYHQLDFTTVAEKAPHTLFAKR